MALYIVVSVTTPNLFESKWYPYEMLAKFDKDASILFQHNQGSFGASFVTCFQHVLLFVMVLGRFSFV